MSDTDNLTDLEVLACTLIGEAESMGSQGMVEVANVILNRVKENWFAKDIRDACLRPYQFSCWNQGDNADRSRILEIAQNNPLYGPYVNAMAIAGDAINDRLVDCTNDAVSYFNHKICSPEWALGKTPCYVNEPVWYFNLDAVR